VRIHYVSHAAIPSREANSLQVMKMCAAFAAAGHALTLFARQGPERDEPFAYYGIEPAFRLERLRGGRLRVVGRAGYSWRLTSRLAREEPPELVFGRDLHSLALLALRGGARAPLVLEAHQPPRHALERRLAHLLFRHASFRGLVCISAALAAEYRRAFGHALRVPIVVAHDGADVPRQDPPPPRAPGPFALGYVGHLYPGKGLELIARLAALLPDCAFHVVGGHEEDLAVWRPRLVTPNVHLHGHLPHAEAQRRMRAFDALLAPYQDGVWIGGGVTDVSRWMSPLKVFEYMASGRPMIASDLAVLREVLRDGENALLVPAAAPEAWAQAVRKLREDPGLGGRLAARAREDLARRHTWDRRVELVLGALGP
jgi:glycosyltransferase involved in cell wall biosynthesis